MHSVGRMQNFNMLKQEVHTEPLSFKWLIYDTYLFTVINTNILKNAVFWDVATCRSCSNRLFGGTYHLHLQGRKIRERGTNVSRWLQTLCEPMYGRNVSPRAHVCSSLADFSTLKMKAIRSSETSVITRSTRRHIPEDGILHSHLRENLRSDVTIFSMFRPRDIRLDTWYVNTGLGDNVVFITRIPGHILKNL
jgi:hypothetical protein